MVHKTINSFPSIGSEINLPIYMNAVGCNEYEVHIKMPIGDPHHLIKFASRGEGILKTDGKEYRIKENMGYFVKANTPFEFIPMTKCCTYFISFGGFATEALLEQLDWLPHFIFSNLDIVSLNNLQKKMYLLSTEIDFPNRCQTSALTYEYIMSIYVQQNQKTDENSVNFTNSALLFAKRYIEQYYFLDLTLDTLAECANVSPQHLCRLFQKYMKMRPIHYITQIRIKIAKQQLSSTSKSIKTISEEVGFHNPYYFSNTFKKTENMTPLQYRIMTRRKGVVQN